MNTSRIALLAVLTALSTALFASCASGPDLKAGQTAVMNMTPLDLKACYPRLDRDWGDETQVSGMLTAVRDTYPRMRECANDYFFRGGDTRDELSIALKVEPDHSVSTNYSTEIEDPVFRSCIEEALEMVELPKAVDPAGQTVEATYLVDNRSDDALRINHSKTGTIIGSIRTNALNACACFDNYKNKDAPNQAFAFALIPDSPYPQDVRPIGEVDDPELANCLAKHLSETKIRRFDSDLKAKYRFKTKNSRALSPERLANDAAEMHNRGEYAAALETYKKALGIEPTHIQSLLGAASVYLDVDQPEDAMQLLEKAIDNGAHENSVAYYRMGRAQLMLGDLDEAEKSVEESLNIEEDSFHALEVMADIKLEKGELVAAMNYADKGQEANPDYMPVYVTKARVQMARENHDGALETLKAATKLDHVDPNAYLGLAQVYMELEEYDQSLEAFDTARDRGVDSSYVYYNMGIVYQHKGNRDKAREMFCTAAEKKPYLQQAVDACNR